MHLPHRPSVTTIGTVLVSEMADIIDRLGPDHPDLIARLGDYVATLDSRYPGWAPVMERVRLRRIDRVLGRSGADARLRRRAKARS